MGELSQEEQQYQLQLANAGGFTLEDLEANRAGRRSERQVKERNRGCLILTLIGIGYGALSFILGLVAIILGLVSGEGNAEGNYSAGLFCIIQGLVIVGVCLYRRKRDRAIPEESLRISFIEGIPVRSKTGKAKQGTEQFYFRFEDGTKIRVSKKVYTVLQGRQRIYYFDPPYLLFRPPPWMLSIEVLPRSWNPAESQIKGTVERKEG